MKIKRLTKFKGDTLKASEDNALQSREILQTLVWWGYMVEGGRGYGGGGALTCPTPYKRL